MTHKGLEFWINKDIRRRAYDVSIVHVDSANNQIGVVQPFVVHVRENTPDQPVIVPAVSLTYEEAADLMTELWRAGVRPEGVGTTGELAAVKYHLEDMRKLVFKT